MTKLNKKVLTAIANIGVKSAIKANGAASIGGCHQPKEPKNINKFTK